MFTASARTQEAHDASLVIIKALAHTGFRLVDDNEFLNKVMPMHDKVVSCCRFTNSLATSLEVKCSFEKQKMEMGL